MNLPGSARVHVWSGLIVALVGVLVGGYAYTGDRVYQIEFLPVALLGLVLVLAGSALAGYGQANRPRLGGRQADEDEGPSLVDRLRGLVGLDDDEDGEDDEDQSDRKDDEDQGDEAETDETVAGADEAGDEADGADDEDPDEDKDED